MRHSTWLLLCVLPFAACDCTDSAATLRAYCHEQDDCVDECTYGTAESSGGYGMTTTRSYCRPRDEDVCEAGPVSAVDEDGLCWQVETSCLPLGFEAMDCEPGMTVAPGEEPNNAAIEPEWAESGPDGLTCPDGCGPGERCFAGVCALPCKADPACGEDETCVGSGDESSCVPTITCQRGHGDWEPEVEACGVTYSECVDGRVYAAECEDVDGEQECTCLIDGQPIASFRWYDGVCFCDTESLLAHQCEFPIEIDYYDSCEAWLNNNLAGPRG